MTEFIFDADRHVSEPVNMWRDYLPRKYIDYAPYLKLITETPKNSNNSANLISSASYPQLYIKDKPLLKGFTKKTFREALQENDSHGDPASQALTGEGQLRSMNEQDVNQALLIPTIANYCINADFLDAKVSEAFVEAYNRWLQDYCRVDPKRLLGVGAISRNDVDNMLSELNRVIDNKWPAVIVRPEPVYGKSIGHPDYLPFWRACEEANITVLIHGGTHLQGATVGSDRFVSRFALHACAHPLEAQLAFLSLLEGGVLESFPQLRFVFLESGASWLPAWLWRLDEHCYKTAKADIENHIRCAPSEYFKRQCWIGFELDEPKLNEIADCIGVDKLLYGTDFPHPDHLHYDKAKALLSKNFSDEDIKRLMGFNSQLAFPLASAVVQE